ncbi:hypothetical protein [Nocardia otitidiscaviarum]|uniref:hypothetical protein n=1 Tax=Nocardia otitidiscaviarum TaxID=1823 RepID=UPI0018931F67|nr:hypothetical protein [Nocardia otitidiscaviarum]MBF6177256.1 hypothetical protein [Nocardia otitidiscaviarum]
MPLRPSVEHIEGPWSSARCRVVGPNCSAYRVAVHWRNLDTGRTSGQSHQVNEHGEIRQAPDGVITGFGMGPGAGRVEAWIVTQYDDGAERELEHISGRASFTLG